MSKNRFTCTPEPSDLSQVRPVAFASDPDQPDCLSTHLRGVWERCANSGLDLWEPWEHIIFMEPQPEHLRDKVNAIV